MKLKHMIGALSLGFASVAASAAPAQLDAIYGNLDIKLAGLTTEYNTQTGTNESTWGIGRITTITSNTTGDEWSAGGDGTYLYYIIYGIADLGYSAGGAFGTNIYNVGATGNGADGKIHLDIFRSTTNLLELTTRVANPNDRTAYNMYSAFESMGPAYLQFEFAQGIITQDDPSTPFDERLTTLFQNATSIDNPATGKGSFFLDVIGGTAADKWDTNGVGNGKDASGNFTLRPNFGFSNDRCTQDQALGTPGVNPTCFAGFVNDPIEANKIPEPGSLALLGLGFAGLAGLRRRKAAK